MSASQPTVSDFHSWWARRVPRDCSFIVRDDLRRTLVAVDTDAAYLDSGMIQARLILIERSPGGCVYARSNSTLGLDILRRIPAPANRFYFSTYVPLYSVNFTYTIPCKTAGIRITVQLRTTHRAQTNTNYSATYRTLTFFTVFFQPENFARAQTVRTSPLSAFSYNSPSNISMVCSLKSPWA